MCLLALMMLNSTIAVISNEIISERKVISFKYNSEQAFEKDEQRLRSKKRKAKKLLFSFFKLLT